MMLPAALNKDNESKKDGDYSFRVRVSSLKTNLWILRKEDVCPHTSYLCYIEGMS